MLVKEIGDHLEWPLWRAALPRPPQAAPAADPARVVFVTASPVAAAAARAAGLRVEETADAWAAAAALLDAGDAELVGVLLGDVTPTRAWLDATLLAFDGDRVAAVARRGRWSPRTPSRRSACTTATRGGCRSCASTHGSPTSSCAPRPRGPRRDPARAAAPRCRRAAAVDAGAAAARRPRDRRARRARAGRRDRRPGPAARPRRGRHAPHRPAPRCRSGARRGRARGRAAGAARRGHRRQRDADVAQAPAALSPRLRRRRARPRAPGPSAAARRRRP